jgi:hypothetical protein
MTQEKIRSFGLSTFGAFGFCIFGAAFLYTCYLIFKYAVNIPGGDELEALAAPAFKPNMIFWLFARHNEHIIFPTKVFIKIMFFLNRWNLRTEQIISFYVFSVVPFSFAFLSRKILPKIPFGIIFAFLFFLMGTTFVGNHFSGYMSQMHFVHIFKLWALFCLFHPSQKTIWIVLGAISAGLAVVSFGTGTASAATILGIFLLFKLLKLKNSQLREENSKQTLLHLALAGVSLGAVALAAVRPFLSNLKRHQICSPMTNNFWFMLSKLVGRGLSFPDPAPIISIIAFVVLLALPIGILLSKGGFLRKPTHWMLLAGVCATLAELLLMTIGRAVELNVNDYIAGRYCEISLLLIPWATVLWLKVLENSRVLPPFLIGLWCLFAVNSRTEFNYPSYPGISAYFTTQAPCLVEYYKHGGPGLCPLLYPYPMADKLDRARNLNLSFYQELMSGNISGN